MCNESMQPLQDQQGCDPMPADTTAPIDTPTFLKATEVLTEALTRAEMDRENAVRRNEVLMNELDALNEEKQALEKRNKDDRRRYQENLRAIMRRRMREMFLPTSALLLSAALTALFLVGVNSDLVDSTLGMCLAAVSLLVTAFFAGVLFEQWNSRFWRPPHKA